MNTIKSLIVQRKLLYELTLNEFKSRYLGSYLGIIWAFIQPAITILIFWFVFQVGFKTLPVNNVPFILWLMAGIIPWFFFTDSLGSGTHSITGNSFLVKKIAFRVGYLPIIKILSALVIHVFFVLVLFIMLNIYGFKFNIYQLQVIYYSFAILILVLGVTLITSSLNVFFRDMGELVGMCIQFGFWLTPIFWSFNIVPDYLQIYFKLNPVFYIVNGYRDALLYQKVFWEDIYLTVYFWAVVFFLLCLGSIIFKKLRPHFSDVL